MFLKILFSVSALNVLVCTQEISEFSEQIQKIISPLSWLDSDQLETLMSNEDTSSNLLEPKNDFSLCDEEKQFYPNVSHPEFGVARGKVLKSLNGREFYAFHSIPYAKPVNAEKRFMMPEKWEGKWNEDGGEFDATYIRAKCPQLSIVLSIPAGREDCLHISIYTPDTINKYPVMFFIHGGAFISGDATLYVPTKMMNRDVVLVVVQYRLGSLGFLASGREDNPGNMGLMDQIMALKWVQDHIAYFGGDPDSVTVFGHSAGAASASWLQLSPLVTNETNPLMQRIILESGSALEAWAHDPDPEESFEMQAREVDCWVETATDPVADALQCMRMDRTVQELVEGYIRVYVKDRAKGGLGFKGNCPVIQRDLAINHPELSHLVVIPDDPVTLIKEGKFLRVPIMAGTVRDEGSLVLGLAYESFLAPNNLTDNSSFLAVEGVPFFVRAFEIEDTTGSVANSLEMAFLKYAKMGEWDSMSGGLVDMSGMLSFKSGIWTLSHLLAHQNVDNDIFFYSFEFESDDSIFDWYFLFNQDIPIKGGITHGDELLYMFHLPSMMLFDQDQLTTVERITKLWTNFAKYGDPTPQNLSGSDGWEGDVPRWTPFSIKDGFYMLVSDNFMVKKDFTLRWNPNTLPDPSCQVAALSAPVVTIQEELPDEDIVSLLKEETNGWKLAMGVMGACCLLLVVSIFLLLLRIRK